jgi:hypothetical protein
MTLTGNITINFSNAINGQKLLLRLTQDGTGGRVATWGTSITFGTDIDVAVLSTAASKVDYVGFVYNGASTKYNLIALSRGY